MTQGTEVQAELVAAYVAARAGVSISGPRQPELLARVSEAMARAGATTAQQFRRLLDHDAEALDELVVTLTVGESYFFRESTHMEMLRRTVLPERADARGPGGTLRLWSAGCSGGQEPYTLAILLQEEGLGLRSHVLATDLSRQAVERARAGVYLKWSLRALDDRQRRTYFREVPGGFRVDPSLARRITFRQHNLLDVGGDQPTGDMDVVLCRNLLVYLTPAAIEEAGRRLVDSLVPGGWLLTASTDPHLEGIEGLQTVHTPSGIVYRRLTSESPATKGSSQLGPRPGGATTRGPRPSRPGPVGPARPAPAPRRSPPASTAQPAATDPLLEARRALEKGEYERAATLAVELSAKGGDGEAEVVLVRALGSAGSLVQAADAAAEAVTRFPLSVELRLLQAMVLLESDLPHDAATAAKAALYVDPGLAMAHLTLARAEQARGDGPAAHRSYRNAVALLEGVPADQEVPLAEGETAGRLAGLGRAGRDLAQQSAVGQ